MGAREAFRGSRWIGHVERRGSMPRCLQEQLLPGGAARSGEACRRRAWALLGSDFRAGSEKSELPACA